MHLNWSKTGEVGGALLPVFFFSPRGYKWQLSAEKGREETVLLLCWALGCPVVCTCWEFFIPVVDRVGDCAVQHVGCVLLRTPHHIPGNLSIRGAETSLEQKVETKVEREEGAAMSAQFLNKLKSRVIK